MITAQIPIPYDAIAAFCQRWGVTEFALFGSVLRPDFRPDSDIDVLVSFAPGSEPSLFDIMDMQAELETLFGRKVDLGERRWVEHSRNPFRRRAILSSLESIYVA